MPRNIMDMETMELYKRMPAYKDAGYHYGEFCSNCGQNEYNDVSRNIATRKKRMKNYERHCPSCHCPPERRRFSPPGGPRTSEHVEAMLNRYERVSAEPISSTIKKSQSSPLSQKVCWHDCQVSAHPRCPRRSLHAGHQRRTEHDRYSFRTKGDAMNSELTNEDVEACAKYAQSVPVKSSLKKHNHCREPEGSPDEQEYSDAESEVSTKYAPCVRQPMTLRDPNLGSRRHCVGGDGEYIAETRHEVDRRRNARVRQEMRRLAPGLEDYERLKRGDGEASAMMSEDDKAAIERRKVDVARATKQKRSGDATHCLTSKPPAPIKESINRPVKELVLDASAHLTKLDLHTTKNRILESIDHMLGTMDDAKNEVPMQQEQTEQEIEKITRELQENGWQLLFNALTIHRDSTNSSRRTVRLECLNHIRQQLDKLYALESTLDNCQPGLQSLSNHDMSHNEEHQQSQQQQLEQKIADS